LSKYLVSMSEGIDLPASKAKPVAHQPDPDANETRGAVAITVAWMLLTLSCAAAQVVAFAMWLVARQVQVPVDRPNALFLIPSTLMIVAVISGLLVLALSPITYYVRKARPPRAVTIVAVLIALLPMISIAMIAVGTAEKPARQELRPPNPEPRSSTSEP
jgi:vacuolar-type H+-ATPase subunit I/STV1